MNTLVPWRRSAILVAACSLLSATSLLANLPGGGTSGANVTLTDNGDGTVTMANGIVSIHLKKSTGVIDKINYTCNNSGSPQTLNLLGGGYRGGMFYWENSSDLGPSFSYAVVADPAANGGNYAEIVLTAYDVPNIVMEAHYSLLRGNSGFYVTPIWIHRSTDGAFSIGECRDNIYSGSIFNWMSVDAQRNKLMPVSGGSAIGVDSGPKEVSLWTNGIYAGQYEDKYKYTADYGLLRAWGWSSVGSGGKNVGLWDVAGSFEYMASGPMRRELTSHMGTTILNTPHGAHYGFCSDSTWAAGEVWAKVCGPHFIYCNAISNTITATNAAAQALYADALAQADAESGAWPYAWFTNSYYAPAANRGTVAGKIVINDSFNPAASASNLWVGVEQQPVTNSTITYDFQKWYKPYQFWVKTDANGNFTIPDVIAGTNYTLYAFGPGAAGTFQSQNLSGGNPPNELDLPASPFSVTVTGGATNHLGTITWTPNRVGPTVFEIGYPDRTAGKFRHGEDWWVGDLGPSASAPSPVWSKFLEYPFDFPDGPNYIVGQSRWTTDWNFIQPVAINNTGAYDPWGNNSGTTSTIVFNLASPPSGTASLYLALSSDYQGPLIVKINGTDIAGGTGYFPAYSSSGDGSDASIREGNHGLFSDNRLNFAATLLRSGQNTITINMRKGGYLANHAMYDYVRLELTGYVPPAPTSVRAYAGNNCNLICWPVQPGATGYEILRSTTSGSGYVSLTNGVTGPICGSGWNNASWLDTTAVNGTTYYYVVRSLNPVGGSPNSPEASATPNAGISLSAPATPTGLTIGGVGHHSVTLNWSAPAGADFYTVYRSTLFNNGGGASNVLGTIVLANNVTNTTYTDVSPTDGSIYRYAVAATSAGGTSGNSAAAVAVPKPSPPASLPGSLFITSVITTNPAQNVTLTWNAVDGAAGYAIYRATSASGPFTFQQSVSTTMYYNGGLATNQTYYYRVVALNAAGTSGYAADLINPNQAAPTNLVATASPTDPEITLTWSAAPGATSYTVKRGTSTGNETVTVVAGYSGTTYTNTGLSSGRTYYYVVTASGANGASGNSPEASVTLGSSVWISPANGNWGDAFNWSGGQVADGASSIADFSTLSLPADLTVTLDSPRTVSAVKFGDTSAAHNWTLAGTNTLTLDDAAEFNVVNQSAVIHVPVAGSAGLTKTGPGTLALGGATNTLTGGVTHNAGTLTLDFSAANSPAADLVPAANGLTLGGGALQILGGTNTASSQTFNGLSLSTGPSRISVARANGAANPTLVLGAMPTTPTAGATLEFDGPATTSGIAAVPATATITTITAGTGPGGAMAAFGLGQNGYFATVGQYDWAATTGSGPYTVIGGSQISGFYQTAGVTTGGNYDVNSGGVNTIGNAGGAASLRFNQNAALTINNTTFTWQNCQGILVTPNCGAFNQTIAGNTLQFRRSTSSGNSYGVIWQNNPQGYLNITLNLGGGRQAGQDNGLVQAGSGTVVYSVNGNSYGLNTYLNGGYSVVASDSSFGAAAQASPVTLNGGTVVGNATFAMDDAGANPRPFVMGSNGGGLAATTGNTLTVDGLIGSAAGAGPLAIGIAATSANNFTAGLLPGSGPGTANPTPVYATGTVALTNANYYTGGTVLHSGTLNINGIFALGGANYGGLTFNGGTLQYAANFSGNNGSADLTSIGTAGITLAAGGGTIDLNGNAVTYAGAIGNGGSGALFVKSSLAGGSLDLQGANSYQGDTTVANAVLSVNNASGSATGEGNVLVQNGGILRGGGVIAGSVSVSAGGELSPGGAFNTLTMGGDLTLAAGSTTRMQIQPSPLNYDTITLGGTFTACGTLIVTNVGGNALAAGDTFALFNAGNYSGAFDHIELPPLTGNLVWNTNTLNTSGTISVTTLSSPVISDLEITGDGLVISGAGGVDSWPFYLLSTTNLAAGNWMPVATNQFDSTGHFSVTNALSPNAPQMYFRLQLP